LGCGEKKEACRKGVSETRVRRRMFQRIKGMSRRRKNWSETRMESLNIEREKKEDV